jgi:hypothetical protein
LAKKHDRALRRGTVAFVLDGINRVRGNEGQLDQQVVTRAVEAPRPKVVGMP